MRGMKECVYCTLPEIRARTVVKNDLVWVIPTNIPIVPGHLLILPVRCVAMFEELTEAERAALFEMMSQLKKALKGGFGATGFNVAWNEGELAGQSVPHFHLHLLPRKEGDTGITEYEPRKFLYRPGSREASPESELQAVAKDVREQLEKLTA